jgi:hypothetical protein
MFAAAMFFDRDSEDEQEIRTLADALYRRADWPWACNGGATVTHGWKPESGFLPYRWEGYDEAVLLYVLGLGSPTHPLPTESYAAWASTYEWKDVYGYEFIYGGPLFIHQYSHIWVDFGDIQDAFARDRGIDYCENSRRATYVQREYAIRNPLEFAGYGEHFWGLTASDGPGWTTRRIRGVERSFFDYVARGAPYGPDDGTVAPWAVVASLPFAPEIVLPTVWNFQDVYPVVTGEYCFRCSFNLTFETEADADDAPDDHQIADGSLLVDDQRVDAMEWRPRRATRANACPRTSRRRATSASARASRLSSSWEPPLRFKSAGVLRTESL